MLDQLFTFLSTPPSEAKVDPYFIPIPSSSTGIQIKALDSSSKASSLVSSPPPIPLLSSAEPYSSDHDDRVSFLLESYAFAAVTSPLSVIETLSEVQCIPYLFNLFFSI